ncbi:hypothetical protein [Synechococcus sp. CS-1327]|uniref:hypothetical protein n=1 Tax=Synechococcus sp. CS-1327 TaxID=2847977 RepID=UPI00223C256E|nr:hypothetical protein [Synechococcus sp. CS-1327]MCT0231906.1 hypothetical protein [Synechococcus sp. CS-1327]
MTEGKWYNVTRIVHLVGGLRAINKAGSEVVIPLGSNDPMPTFSIDKYHDLPWVLISLGFKIVGIDYYETSQQAQGYYPPTWYPFHADQENKDAPLNAENQWSWLANAAFKAERIELMDICSRMAFEIRACNLRLRKLSEAYNVELWSLCEQQQFSPGKVETLNSFSIYLETHDLLRELCTLRDYLAEFVAAFVLKSSLNTDDKIYLMSMASLIKQIGKAKITANSIASELCGITNESEGGWLAKLSAYRDLVVHYVPLGQATKKEFVVRGFLPSSNLGNLPSINFPIPSNPFSVKQVRSKGSPFETVSDWIEASKQDDDSAPDALEYCLYSVGNMMSLACKIAKEAPILPEMPTFVKEVDIEEVV